MNKDNPIFIVGAQRSGTTLLRLILNAHPLIAIPEEGAFFTPILRRKFIGRALTKDEVKKMVRYLELNKQYKLWNYKSAEVLNEIKRAKFIEVQDLISSIYESYAKSEGKVIWGDKTPSFFRKLGILFTLFSKAKSIHIVRDARDTFISWRKLDPSMNNPAVMALEWRYKVHKIQKEFEKIDQENRIQIRYEDMITDPKKVLILICNLCGIEFSEKMLNFYELSDRYIGTHHSDLIFKPIDSRNKAMWESKLTDREKSIFNILVGSKLKELNYPLTDFNPTVIDYLVTIKLLLMGLPYRLLQIISVRISYAKALRKGEQVENIKIGLLPKERSNTI